MQQQQSSYERMPQLLGITACQHQHYKTGSQSHPERKQKFPQQHIDYLCDYKTLRYWAYFPLDWLAVLLQRQFPEVRISPQTIANIYRRNGITFKTVNRVKRVIDFEVPFYRNNQNFIYDQMQRAIANNIKFIHADEAVFTFNTFIKKSWYKMYNNIEVYDQKVKVVTHSILGGISEDIGLETYAIHPRSIKREQYIKFLHKLREKYQDQEIILFVDNLSVHMTKESKKAYGIQTQLLFLTFLIALNLMELNSTGAKSRLTTRSYFCIIQCMIYQSIQQIQYKVVARE